MNKRKIIKKGIYVGASAMSALVPNRHIKVPGRKSNLELLYSFSKDHPIYTEDTFHDELVLKSVDVSIVIPFYCAKQKYIEDCLYSLINQNTRFSYTIICVDDGSKDDTLQRLTKIAEKYPDKVYVYHQENAGISCARNKGIQIANSTYIGFVDQDDWVEPSYIERLISIAVKRNADVVKCSHKVVDNQEILSEYLIPDTIINGKKDSTILQYSGMIWGGFYNRDILKKVRFPEKYWYEDMIARNLLYRCAERFVSISDVLYVKRKHKENASKILWNGKNNKCYDHLYLFKHILEENTKLGLDNNLVLKKSILHEMGQYLMWRTRGQDSRARKIAFVEACYVVKEYIESDEGLDKIEKEYYGCFERFDYTKWLLYSWKDWALTE
ncbi:glycosyltransferase family 2 protein [Bulleidia sp. HCP3S3_F2]|uniref:glycosyltransferase family 2 protein n=1 Tax=unclassified Bulleidia TaxID=2704656 RepID=UPI003F8A7A88